MKFAIGQIVYYAALQRQATVIDTVERPEGFPQAYWVEDAEATKYGPIDEDELVVSN